MACWPQTALSNESRSSASKAVLLLARFPLRRKGEGRGSLLPLGSTGQNKTWSVGLAISRTDIKGKTCKVAAIVLCVWCSKDCACGSTRVGQRRVKGGGRTDEVTAMSQMTEAQAAGIDRPLLYYWINIEHIDAGNTNSRPSCTR